MREADSRGTRREDILVLDAGSGFGELAVYLACKEYRAVGVDISTEACVGARKLAKEIGVAEGYVFLAGNLESISLPDSSVYFIIGHASLKYFIKYQNVPNELARVLRHGGKGFFADSFGENPLFQTFYDRKAMERMGEVPLSREMILDYFGQFDVGIVPTDWFVMLDRLYSRILPRRIAGPLKQLSRLHYWLDRRISTSSSNSLVLSGSVMTTIAKK